MAASLVIIVLGFVFGYAGSRMTLTDLWHAVVNTAIGLCEILVISATARLHLGLFQVSGLVVRLHRLPGGPGAANLLLLLVLAAVVSIVLGMGLPTIGVYVMLAILVAPALVKVGVPPLAAHLFILYFGMMSLITPPVAPAACRGGGDRRLALHGDGLDRDALRLELLHRAVPLRLLPAILMQGSIADIVIVTVTSSPASGSSARR